MHRDAALRERVRSEEAVILAELNLKALDFEADEGRFASITTKANFATLKKKPGAPQQMGALKSLIESLPLGEEGRQLIAKIERGESFERFGIEIAPEGHPVSPKLEGRCSDHERRRSHRRARHDASRRNWSWKGTPGKS